MKLILTVFLFFSNAVFAWNYLPNLTTSHTKKTHHHVLSIKDKNTKEVLKTIKLADSYKEKAMFLGHEDSSPYVFLYTESKKSTALVQIVNVDKMELVYEVTIDKLTRTKHREKKHKFSMISQDGSKFIAQVGKKSNQKLISIDADSGEINVTVPLKSKKIRFHTSPAYKYIWSYYQKLSSGNKVTVYEANTLEIQKEIPLRGKYLDATVSEDYLFIREKFVNSKQPEDNKFTNIIYKFTQRKVYDEFTSSTFPHEFFMNNKPLLIGRSIEQPYYLKVVDFNDGQYTDISNKNIDSVVEVVKGYAFDGKEILIIYGEKSVVKFDVLNPENSVVIKTPFKIEGGIVSKDLNRVYVNANFGAKIGLVDFKKNRFVGSDHTGSKAKKVGNALMNLAVMAATGAATGVAYAPGFKLSANTLMLSTNQKFLFAINTKTNDVSVFNADNLSNKRIYPIGKYAVRIMQATHEPDLPVVIISHKKVSFFDADTGKLIYQRSYDGFVETTEDLNLIYVSNNKRGQISLYDKTLWKSNL